MPLQLGVGANFNCAINYAAEAAIPAASTVDLGGVDTNRILLTATEPVSVLHFGERPNQFRLVRFDPDITLVHSSSLSLIGGVSRTTQSGSRGTYVSDTLGNWQELDYQPVSSLPGQGVPPGGATGQALIKESSADFATRWSDVAYLQIPADEISGSMLPGFNIIHTSGYYTAGDGGDATYRKVLSVPSHPGYVQDAEGRIFEMVPGPELNVHALGARGDGSTDDTTAISNAYVTAGETGIRVVRFNARRYVSGNITFNLYNNIRFVGAQSNTPGAVAGCTTIVWNGTATGNLWVGSFVAGLTIENISFSSPTAMSTSSVLAATGSRSFQVPAGLTFVAGMVIVVGSMGSGDWMRGTVSSYSGTTLTCDMAYAIYGGGTRNDWQLVGVRPPGSYFFALVGANACRTVNFYAYGGGGIHAYGGGGFCGNCLFDGLTQVYGYDGYGFRIGNGSGDLTTDFDIQNLLMDEVIIGCLGSAGFAFAPQAGFYCDQSGGTIHLRTIRAFHVKFGICLNPGVGEYINWLRVGMAILDTMQFNPNADSDGAPLNITPHGGGLVQGCAIDTLWTLSSATGAIIKGDNTPSKVSAIVIGKWFSFQNQKQGASLDYCDHVEVQSVGFTNNSQASEGTYSGLLLGAHSNFSSYGGHISYAAQQTGVNVHHKFNVEVDAGFVGTLHLRGVDVSGASIQAIYPTPSGEDYINGRCTIIDCPGSNNVVDYSAHGSTSTFMAMNHYNVLQDDVDCSGPSPANGVMGIMHRFGGSSMTGGRQTLFVQSVLASPSSGVNPLPQYVAGSFLSHSFSSDGGTGVDILSHTKGAIYAINPITRVGLAAVGLYSTNLSEATGAEFNIGVDTGSSAWYVTASSLVSLDTHKVHGARYDSLLALSAIAGGVGMNHGILFGAMNGAMPLAAAGTAIGWTSLHRDGVSGNISATIANAIDFSEDLTITGSLLKGPNGFDITGLGRIESHDSLVLGPTAYDPYYGQIQAIYSNGPATDYAAHSFVDNGSGNLNTTNAHYGTQVIMNSLGQTGASTGVRGNATAFIAKAVARNVPAARYAVGAEIMSVAGPSSGGYGTLGCYCGLNAEVVIGATDDPIWPGATSVNNVHGLEIDVFGEGTINGLNNGLRVVSYFSSDTTEGTDFSAAIAISKHTSTTLFHNNATVGWAHGISISDEGNNNWFPIANGGSAFFVKQSAALVQLSAGLDLSQVVNGFSQAAIKLPDNCKIRFAGTPTTDIIGGANVFAVQFGGATNAIYTDDTGTIINKNLTATGTLLLNGLTPIFRMRWTDSPTTDRNLWSCAINQAQMAFATLNDAETLAYAWLTINRGTGASAWHVDNLVLNTDSFLDLIVASHTVRFNGATLFPTVTHDLSLGSADFAWNEIHSALLYTGGIATTGNIGINPPSADSTLVLNPQAAHQATILFDENSVAKWQLGKQTDNTFFLYDAAAGKVPIAVSTGPFIALGGPLNTASLITINQNDSASLPAIIDNEGFRLAGADSTPARFTVDTFAGVPNVTFRRANGTAASPAALAANDLMAQFSVFGYGTAYSGAARAAFRVYADEAWGASAHGTRMSFYTTAKTTTTMSERFRIADNGDVSVLSNTAATSPTAGALMVAGGIAANGGIWTGSNAVVQGMIYAEPGTGNEALRFVGNGTFLTFFDATQTTRSGYIQGYDASYLAILGINGVAVYSKSDGSTGMYIAQNASQWTQVSDRRAKRDEEPLDGRSILLRLKDFQAYSYTNIFSGTKEIGVFGQDFYRLFPHFDLVKVGDDEGEKIVGFSDPRAWGVSYAKFGVVALEAVKALDGKLEREVDRLRSELAEIRSNLH